MTDIVDRAQLDEAMARRAAVQVQGAPGDEFLDVFEDDHAREYLAGPFDHDPGKISDIAADGFGALGLGEMFAVRAGPK